MAGLSEVRAPTIVCGPILRKPLADTLLMVIVRPVAMADLEALVELASLAGVGLTTLPKDRDLLAKRILQSQASFQRFAERPGGESYLFVMQDSESTPPRVIGACGIVSKVGGF